MSLISIFILIYSYINIKMTLKAFPMLTIPDKAIEQSEAFEAMVSPHMSSLSTLSIWLTRDVSRAQDLVQDTLLKGYRFLHRFEPGTNFRAWLTTIMRHLYFSQLRKHSREILTEDVEYFAPAIEHPDPTGPEFEHLSTLTTYLPHLVSDEVFQALQLVPETYRTAVLLADVLDYSYKDMALVMECPIGTVMSRLYRGRQKLQQHLQAYAITEGYIQTEPLPFTTTSPPVQLSSSRLPKQRQHIRHSPTANKTPSR